MSEPRKATLVVGRPARRPRSVLGPVLIVLLLFVASAAALIAAVAVLQPDFLDKAIGRVQHVNTSACEPAEPKSAFYHRVYQWSFNGEPYGLCVDIPRSAYDHFTSLSRPNRISRSDGNSYWEYDYPQFVAQPEDDQAINTIASKLHEIGAQQGWNDDQVLSFVLDFVQSMPYTSDKITTGKDDYPRFPLETLVGDAKDASDLNGGGDCEDTSILYASLVMAMGYGAILVSPPGHMAVGVLAKDGVPGSGYEFNNHWYLYAETTGDGFSIGEIPDEFKGQTVEIYPLN